jgi:hypothetical protein
MHRSRPNEDSAGDSAGGPSLLREKSSRRNHAQGETLAGLQFNFALAALEGLREDPTVDGSGSARRSVHWRPQLLCYVWWPRADASDAECEADEADARSLLLIARALKEGKGLTVVTTVRRRGGTHVV